MERAILLQVVTIGSEVGRGGHVVVPQSICTSMVVPGLERATLLLVKTFERATLLLVGTFASEVGTRVEKATLLVMVPWAPERIGLWTCCARA
jgi:hypothetical protein